MQLTYQVFWDAWTQPAILRLMALVLCVILVIAITRGLLERAARAWKRRHPGAPRPLPTWAMIALLAALACAVWWLH